MAIVSLSRAISAAVPFRFMGTLPGPNVGVEGIDRPGRYDLHPDMRSPFERQNAAKTDNTRLARRIDSYPRVLHARGA